MELTPAGLAAIYCVPIVLACLIGGWLPGALKLTHTRMQAAVSFVAGVILGVGLLHLLPHGFFELGSIDAIMGWVTVGFLAMFFVERFLHFHHHDAPEGEVESPESKVESQGASGAGPSTLDVGPSTGHSHGPCDQHHHHADEYGLHVHASTWMGTAFGMTLHSIIDGLALAAAVKAEWDGDTAGAMLAGLGVFLAVLLHKPFDSLTISMLMDTARCSPSQRHLINGLYAIVVPLGVAIFFLGTEGLGGGSHQFLGATLGLAAGAFICIATSDLLPELQFHTHDRMKLTVSLLLGIGLAWGVIYLESAGHDHHDHDHDHGPDAHQHDH